MAKETEKIHIMLPHTYQLVGQSESKAFEIEPQNHTSLLNDAVPDSTNSANRRWFLYAAVCTGNLATLACGISFGWTSPEIPKLRTPDENSFNSTITENEEGWIGSLLPLGAVIGSVVAGLMADNLGRKKTLLLGTIPLIVAFAINVIARNIYYFFISRFLCGFSVGTTYMILPIYVAEVAEDDIRGSLGTFMLFFCNTGLLISYVLGPFMSIQLFNIICIIPVVAFMILFYLFVPESPYFFIIKKDMISAENALMKLRQQSNHCVQKELEEIKYIVDEALGNKASIKDIFKSRGLAKALLLSNGILIFQQLSGINVVLFYSENIFMDSDVSFSPAICSIMIGVVQVLASAASSAIIERFGKRLLLMFSCVGLALSLASLAYFFYQKNNLHADVSNISWLPLASLIVYIITFCLGFGPISWAILGELFPANLKSLATTLSSIVSWFAAFIVTRYFIVIVELIGQSGSFGFFSFCCCLASLFIYFWLPETSGKSLQEIQDILNGNIRDITVKTKL